MQTADFFTVLWQQYTARTPQAQAIYDLFASQGEKVVNDHVAFRTFDCPQVGLAALQPHLLEMGYEVLDDYAFPGKHLKARAFLHPDETIPKVFVSALERGVLSKSAEALLDLIVAQIPDDAAADASVFSAGRLWETPSLAEYELLASESEYASWLAVHGYCANHFTVSVNHLHGFGDMAAVLDAVKGVGFALNTVGGEIKGVPADLLVQGSTLADQQTLEFRCGKSAEVPTCFYEFAERFADSDGAVFQGFLAANADKIFESTWRQS